MKIEDFETYDKEELIKLLMVTLSDMKTTGDSHMENYSETGNLHHRLAGAPLITLYNRTKTRIILQNEKQRNQKIH